MGGDWLHETADYIGKNKGEVAMNDVRKNEVRAISSIRTKIVLFVVAAIILPVVVNLINANVSAKKSITKLAKNYMEDIALITGQEIEQEIELQGWDTVMAPEEFQKKFGFVKVKDVDSSYGYAVDAGGTMLYHPTADKIGQLVENAAVKQIIAEMGKGNRPETDVIVYDFKGVTKCASFYVGKNMDFIFVITADEEEMLADVSAMTSRSILFGILSLIACVVVGFVVASRIVKPIEQTTKDVVRISELDFTSDGTETKAGKDEAGVMKQAIEILRQQLHDVVVEINGQSKELHDIASMVSRNASETSNAVEQVERAVAEIAEGATSQAQDTQSATEQIILMGNMIEETDCEVGELRTTARGMRQSGEKALEIISELGKVNDKTKSAIDVIARQTEVTNESTKKIKAAVDIITDIAEETNLLSLNASIEAARAGEQGRGFAVVASQIQKLAEQSNESAKQITEIIKLLIDESEKSVETMEEVKAVVRDQDENVAQTEAAFNEVKIGIDSSIEGIRNIITKTKQLDEARVKVVDIVQSLTAIAEQNAASTEETSASAVEVGAIMQDIAANAKKLDEIEDLLYASISKLKI